MKYRIQSFSLALVTLVFLSSCSKPQSTGGTVDKGTVNDNKTTNVVAVNSDGTNTTINPAAQIQNTYIEKPLDPKDIMPPMEAIKHLDEMVSGYQLGQNLTAEQVKQNTDLKQRIIQGTFDIRELCRLSLGKHWDEINEDQRKEFVGLMTKLLETKAIFSKEQLHGENKLYNITYQKESYDDVEKKKSTVLTKMNIHKERTVLGITYKMLLTPYGWKIFDVIVDDASLLSNYKFQFDRIIAANGYNDLITRMKKKLEDISK